MIQISDYIMGVVDLDIILDNKWILPLYTSKPIFRSKCKCKNKIKIQKYSRKQNR